MAESSLSKDQERLAKLWDAYEVQEKELELAMKNIANLETKIKEMNRVNTVLKKAVEDKDKEIRDLELKVISLEEDNSKFQPKINELEKVFKDEKERYSKLFAITEELEEELAKTRIELEIKDKWFEKNVGMFENIRQSIIERNVKLKDISTEKKLSETVEKPEEETTNIAEIQKEEEKITFKTIEVKPPEKEIKPELSKNETLNEFIKIPEVNTELAERLYDSGYVNLEKLKSATTEDLANLEGVSPTMARKIRTSLLDL